MLFRSNVSFECVASLWRNTIFSVRLSNATGHSHIKNHWENQKNKETRMTRPMVSKNHRENKKTKKQKNKISEPMIQNPEPLVLKFCFLFFWFSRWLLLTIGSEILFFLFFWFSRWFLLTIGLVILVSLFFLVFPMVFDVRVAGCI